MKRPRSLDAPTYEMQIDRDKDEIWITVSKSGIYFLDARARWETQRTASVTSLVRVYVSDLDETGGSLARLQKDREEERERETLNLEAADGTLLPLVRVGH